MVKTQHLCPHQTHKARPQALKLKGRCPTSLR